MPRSKSPDPHSLVSNVPLTALEMQIAGEFVSAAGANCIDHSSNDFDLPDTPTHRTLVKAAIGQAKREGVDTDPLHASQGKIHFSDVHLLCFLGPRWEALSERAASGPIHPPLCREELETMVSVLEMLARNEYKEYARLTEAADYSLPLTPESQQFAEAVIRHASGEAGKRIKAAAFGYDIHAVKCLKYLAARCQALAAVSSDKGLAFTGKVAASRKSAVSSTPTGVVGTIPVLKRPGLGPGWLREWKKNVAIRMTQIKSSREDYENMLKRYVAEGKLPDLELSEGELGWQRGLDTEFRSYVATRTVLVEDEALKANSFPVTQWRSLFAATYLQSFGEVNGLIRSTARLTNGLPVSTTDFQIVYHAAMGVVMGFREHGLRLARLHLLIHRLEFFNDCRYFPAAQTLLRIFADYFGEPELTLQGEVLTHPIYNALAKHWRHPDAETLVPVLLAVCDEHTRRNTYRMSENVDGDFAYFARTPVEILLVFKLREELGLANPQLDHPIMKPPLGVLPKETLFAFDELLVPVVKRMRKDGFDEEAILADCVAAVKKQAVRR